jgi:hypothetical protein
MCSFGLATTPATVKLNRQSRIPVIATLDIEYNELTRAWKRFQELLPPSDQVNFKERPQTAQDVRDLVQSIRASPSYNLEQDVFSRSMALCDVFLATLDSHTKPLLTFQAISSTLLFLTVLCSLL